MRKVVPTLTLAEPSPFRASSPHHHHHPKFPPSLLHVTSSHAATACFDCKSIIVCVALRADRKRQTTLKRIHREIADLKKEDLGNITLGPSSDSLFQWKATIPGPDGSVYEGGIFNVDITLAHDYPYVLLTFTS